MEKKQLRQEMLRRREELSQEIFLQENEKLMDQCLAYAPLWDGRMVYTYVSFGREADTRRLIGCLLEKQLPVAVPRVMGKTMAFFQIHSFDDLEPGLWGILEPKSSCREAQDPGALVVVPGAAFDRSGYRIGYGGGYYDRFLSREPEHETVGIGFSFQLLEHVPKKDYDRPVNGLLLPEGYISCISNGD